MYANEVEYEVILTSLRVAKALGDRNLKLNIDSKLVVRQIMSENEAIDTRGSHHLVT